MIKAIYIIIISLMAITVKSSAQDNKTEYLFSNFKESLVYYKDGRVFGVKANYNLARNAFMFIDENDQNHIKLFAQPDMVRTLKVDNRTFRIDSKGLAQEYLSQTPYLTVTYKGKSRLQGKQVGYGGRSETASVDSYSSIQSSGNSYKLETEKMVIANIEKTYTLKIEGKEKRFQTPKQYLKLWPKELKEAISNYIKSHKINFDKPQQVLQLVKYSEGL